MKFRLLLLGGLLAAVFLYVTSRPAKIVDVFLIIGQSNAGANSENAAAAPDASKVALKYQDGALSPASEPIGTGAGGSAWSSLAVTHWQATGRMAAVVNMSRGSTSMLAAADTGTGNWSPTGKLYSASVDQYRAAIKALKAAEYTIGRQAIIDVQGETEADALNLNVPPITAAQFKAAKQALKANYRADLGISAFYFSRLGGPDTGMTPGYREIQRQQEEIGKIGFWGAESFIDRGLMQTGPNTLHYKQAGLNEMGRLLDMCVVSGNCGP